MATENTQENLAGAAASRAGLPGQSAEADVPMSEYEFRLIRDHIHDYCGIFYDDAKAYTLARRISFRLRLLDIASYAEYYNYLKYNPRAKEEMEDLIPHLTNNETYFFREMGQLTTLFTDVLDRVMKAKRGFGGRTLRILSCGCSSGEEAYTIAMLFEENRDRFVGWDAEITGIDIDRKVLEKAGRGLYTSYSLRATEKERMERFFSREGEQYLLEARIRDKVRFLRGNIMNRDVLAAFKGVDVILCRNVLIYFSESAIKCIAENFHDALSEDGFLFLGHSESLARITDIYHTRRYPGAIVYSKKGD